MSNLFIQHVFKGNICRHVCITRKSKVQDHFTVSEHNQRQLTRSHPDWFNWYQIQEANPLTTPYDSRMKNKSPIGGVPKLDHFLVQKKPLSLKEYVQWGNYRFHL